MNKCYYRIVWENYPSDKTPLNEQNLNKIDVAADEMDNRIISLDSTKFDKSEAQLLVKYIEYDEDTGIFKITHYNGTSYTIDTLLEKLAINFDYDYSTQKLIIELSDGTVKYVDLSALITQYEFLDSDTVAFSIDNDGKVTAIVKEGSIEEKHLRPNYLADIKVEVAKAQASQEAAEDSEKNAKDSEEAAKASEESAKKSEGNAAASATNSENSATLAGQRADKAANSAAAAKKSEDNAEAAKNAAEGSASNAQNSENASAVSATSASGAASTATEKALEAENYADLSKSYAKGTGGEVRENDDSDCAEYYYNQTKRISQSLNGVIPMGTITFEELSDPNNQKPGYFFNISDSFVSDERFKDGSGIFYGAGNNVLRTAYGMWDVTAASMVSGVKGGAETEYRQGFVNITPENVGALPVDGNAVSATKATQDGNGENIANTYLKKNGDAKDTTVTFESGDSDNPESWVDIAVFTTKEKLSSLIRKVSLIASNLKYLYKAIGTTDISAIADGTITGAINELNTGLFEHIQYMDMGNYYNAVYNRDSATKDVYRKLPVTSVGFTIGRFSCGFVYHFIAVKLNENYGSLFILSYADVGMICYKYNNGKFYKDTPTCNRTEI